MEIFTTIDNHAEGVQTTKKGVRFISWIYDEEKNGHPTKRFVHVSAVEKALISSSVDLWQKQQGCIFAWEKLSERNVNLHWQILPKQF